MWHLRQLQQLATTAALVLFCAFVADWDAINDGWRAYHPSLYPTPVVKTIADRDE